MTMANGRETNVKVYRAADAPVRALAGEAVAVLGYGNLGSSAGRLLRRRCMIPPRTIFLARLAGLFLLLTSLAMLVQAGSISLAINALVHDRAAVLVLAMIGVGGGLAMILAHNVWSGGRCPGVARSLAEGGHELLTFFRFPKAQWKTLRTTNAIERLNEEFRRRVKTQGSLPTEDAAVSLLFGLVASGQIRLRKIDGHTKLATVIRERLTPAA